MFRGATTGISAFVDTRGVLTAQTKPFTEDALVRDVKRVRLPTFYARVGDVFAWLCVVASGLLLFLGASAPSSRRDWAAWSGVLVAVLSSPILWFANPYAPVGDWIVWGFAVIAVLALPWSGRLRGTA